MHSKITALICVLASRLTELRGETRFSLTNQRGYISTDIEMTHACCFDRHRWYK